MNIKVGDYVRIVRNYRQGCGDEDLPAVVVSIHTAIAVHARSSVTLRVKSGRLTAAYIEHVELLPYWCSPVMKAIRGEV